MDMDRRQFLQGLGAALTRAAMGKTTTQEPKPAPEPLPDLFRRPVVIADEGELPELGDIVLAPLPFEEPWKLRMWYDETGGWIDGEWIPSTPRVHWEASMLVRTYLPCGPCEVSFSFGELNYEGSAHIVAVSPIEEWWQIDVQGVGPLSSVRNSRGGNL